MLQRLSDNNAVIGLAAGLGSTIVYACTVNNSRAETCTLSGAIAILHAIFVLVEFISMSLC